MFPTSSSSLSVAGFPFDASVSVGFSAPGFACKSPRLTSVPLLFTVVTWPAGSLSKLARLPISTSLGNSGKDCPAVSPFVDGAS